MTAKPIVIVTGADLAPQAVKLLGDFEIVYAGKTPQPADLVALCHAQNPFALLVRYGKVNAQMMDAAPALKIIAKHGSGVDTIDLPSAQSRGIAVRAASGANAVAVAEHALAAMLACAKSIPQLNARMHAGHWDKATHKSMELAGKTIGLVGLGAIGARFAKMCAALDMRVLAHDPFLNAPIACVEMVPLKTLWHAADVISLHCPLTDENRNLIDADVLAQCKPGLILINTARGGLIDEAALLDALESGTVKSAALDSFAVEPMTPPHPFHGHPNIILSPHIGGVSAEAYVKMGVCAAQHILDIWHADKSAPKVPSAIY